MATNSLWVGADTFAAVPAGSKSMTAYAEINFADHTIAGATDTVECLKIPKGAFVTNVGLYMKTVTTTNADVDLVGDGADPNGWIDTDFVLDTATNTAQSLPADAYPVLGGKLYEAADTIDILLKTAVPTDGVLVVYATYSMVPAAVNA